MIAQGTISEPAFRGAAQGGTIDRLKETIAREPDPLRRAETFALALADVIKATSNDQNVQRLSRELRAAAADLAAALVPERS